MCLPNWVMWGVFSLVIMTLGFLYAVPEQHRKILLSISVGAAFLLMMALGVGFFIQQLGNLP